MGFELNYCCVCRVQLGPDNFDGICSGCDGYYYCNGCNAQMEEDDELCSVCNIKYDQIKDRYRERGMRIVFTGAAGTGKTTLLNALVEEGLTQDIPMEVFDGLVRKSRKTYNRNETSERTKIRNQKAYNWMYIWKHYWTKSYLSSRAIYDPYAYNLLVCGPDVHRRLWHWALTHVKYDYVFYTPIEFTPEDDGTRPIDLEYQKQHDELIRGVLTAYKIPHVKLTGSVEHRLYQIYTAFEGDIIKQIPQERLSA